MLDITRELLRKYHNNEITDDYKIGDRVRITRLEKDHAYAIKNNVQVGDEGVISKLELKPSLEDKCTDNEKSFCDLVHKKNCIGITLDRKEVKNNTQISMWSCYCLIEKI